MEGGKGFGRTDDKVEKSGESGGFWSIVSICVLALMMWFGAEDDNDVDTLDDF
ncbi:MAG: hypothetical protein OXF05_06080 [Hyphomicrobiales bacterium]|nr:hypothetical protein [Hyphomicrobiales bacterium]